MHAHRVDVFNRTDDDAVVRFIAHNLHLIFFPAQHAFLDQHLAGGRGIQPTLDNFKIFGFVIGNAAARTAHGKAGADNGRQADVIQHIQRLRQCSDLVRTRCREADFGHGLAEPLAVFGLVDRIGAGADHFDVEFFQYAHFFEREGAVQCGLAAHRGQQSKAAGHGIAFFFDDFGDNFRGDRLDIGAVGHIRVGHDGGRIGIDQHDAIAFRPQCLAGLCAGIVEFAGLTNDDRAGTNDKNCRNICTFRHGAVILYLDQINARKKGPRFVKKSAPFMLRSEPCSAQSAELLDQNRHSVNPLVSLAVIFLLAAGLSVAAAPSSRGRE